MDREKIFANDETHKGLISKIYKQFIQLNNKNKQPNQKMGERPKETFLQRKHAGWPIRHMKRCSALLTIRQNANENHNELSPYTSQNDHHQKAHKQRMLARVWRKGNTTIQLAGK